MHTRNDLSPAPSDDEDKNKRIESSRSANSSNTTQLVNSTHNNHDQATQSAEPYRDTHAPESSTTAQSLLLHNNNGQYQPNQVVI
jgi:hypothetical protein